MQACDYDCQWSSPPVASPLPHRRRTWRRKIDCTENLYGRVFKVVEPLHGGSPTLSAMDAGFQWYGKASQLENILDCSGWPWHLLCSAMPFALHSALLQRLLSRWILGGFPPSGPLKRSLKVIRVSKVPRRMPAKAIGLHQSGFWDQRFPSPTVDLQPGGLRLWLALPSYTTRNSVAPMANSARTGGTTRRCCHGHSNVVEATCSNLKPGVPDRATRLLLGRRVM